MLALVCIKCSILTILPQLHKFIPCIINGFVLIMAGGIIIVLSKSTLWIDLHFVSVSHQILNLEFSYNWFKWVWNVHCACVTYYICVITFCNLQDKANPCNCIRGLYMGLLYLNTHNRVKKLISITIRLTCMCNTFCLDLN